MRRGKTWRVGRQFKRVHTFGASVHGHTRHKSNYTFINGHNSDNNNNRNDESRNWRRRQTNELQEYENRLRSVTCCFYYNPKTYLYIYINRFFDIKKRPICQRLFSFCTMLICDLHIFPLEPSTTRPVQLEIPS